uniref:Sucrose phosphatase-like domain-containing protein n=1 Tax=Calcidiscus leptoporus TaxID=127549 RepID=A0A7S0JKK2_9EUKA|mmetsp:Transcript_8293/g.19422  ORF Transcript_8293/g.19422 Transcript_8293/m.19422 type:complete len:287 (+) Transcript_8293:196-1056(+)
MERQPLSSCSTSRLAAVELFLSDMDGTWLGDHHSPTAGGAEAIEEASAAGVGFCFATGRCPLSASLASKLDLSSRAGIYSNGAVVRGAGGAPLYTMDLPAEIVASLIALAKGAGDVCALCNDVDDFWTESLEAPMALHLHDDYGDPYPRAGVPQRAQLVHLVGAEVTIDGIEEQVRQEMGAVVAVGRNLPTDLVISHPDATKGEATKRLCEALGRTAFLCVGDSGNDASMLRHATESGNIGVAMANARPAAMEAAEFVAAGRNTDDVPGVLEAMRAIAAAKKSSLA